MKLRIPVRGLERALSMVARAAAHGNPGTLVLSAALFEAEGRSLRISATDGELGSSLRCSTQVEEEGRLAAGARVLHELVRSLKDGELTLEQKNGVMILSHEGNRYSLHAYDAKGFPEVPEFPRDGGSFTVPAEGFARDIGRVLPSVSKDATRPLLTGVLLSVGKGAVRMVATDSYRMAVTTSKLQEVSEDEKRAIVPARCLAEAVRIAALCEKLTVAITENAAYFKGAGITLKGRLIEGDYPDHTKLLPGSFAREFSVEARTLSATLKRVNLFAAWQNPPAPVRLAFSTGEGSLEGGMLTVSSACAEAGAATERIGVEVEEDFEAAFNGAYLLDGLRACGGERVRLRFNEPLKPAVISPQGEDGKGLAYLVMPVRDPGASPEAPAAEGR